MKQELQKHKESSLCSLCLWYNTASAASASVPGAVATGSSRYYRVAHYGEEPVATALGTDALAALAGLYKQQE